MSERVRIAIVGLGSIGTSVGMALKKAEPEIELIGHDKDHSAARRARKEGAVDRTDWNLISACEDADVVILALPLGEIRETLVAAAPYFKSGGLVMDTASAKAPVLQWAGENVGEGVNFIGGSPILSHGKRGMDPELFSGSLFCLCPASTASPDAVAWASGLVRSMGARPFFIDALEHDGVMAAVDHLPILLAAALLRASSGSSAWREAVRLGGDRFASATASICGDGAAHADLCLCNADSVLRWLDLFQTELAKLRLSLADGDGEALSEALKDALDARDSWERQDVTEASEGPEYERGFRSLLLGGIGQRP
jgi:prephenate dehydrogenase